MADRFMLNSSAKGAWCNSIITGIIWTVATSLCGGRIDGSRDTLDCLSNAYGQILNSPQSGWLWF